jgi:hypothetical protein
MALTRTAKHWLLGLLGAGAAGTGYVVWRRHHEHSPGRLASPQHPHAAHAAHAAHARHYKHENERGHYGHHHHHHKEHDHGE